MRCNHTFIQYTDIFWTTALAGTMLGIEQKWSIMGSEGLWHQIALNWILAFSLTTFETLNQLFNLSILFSQIKKNKDHSNGLETYVWETDLCIGDYGTCYVLGMGRVLWEHRLRGSQHSPRDQGRYHWSLSIVFLRASGIEVPRDTWKLASCSSLWKRVVQSLSEQVIFHSCIFMILL